MVGKKCVVSENLMRTKWQCKNDRGTKWKDLNDCRNKMVGHKIVLTQHIS